MRIYKSQSVFGALAVFALVTLCAGIPGAYLLASAVASYGIVQAGGQGQLIRCEDHVFFDCAPFPAGRD
ncbi:MAG: hypothetical protein M3R44_03780 [Candidatus Eremiobacteraeota bacterium]|nr:hypothetical protein [Candidatus Eremiobacteraeota bacterium]